ncbi:MAG: hypothetical protein ACYCYF_13050 [Anaerolineae bacterium]
MIRVRRRRLLILLALLPLGALLSWLWMEPRYQPLALPDPATLVLRPVDLILQLALMLVAALGVRTLLPSDDETAENGGVE